MSNDVSAAYTAIENNLSASPSHNTSINSLPGPEGLETELSDGVESGLPLSGEDEDEFSSEDHLGSLEDASPQSEGGYMSASLSSLTQNNHALSNGGMTHTTTFNPLQTLSMPMTISTPSGAI
ncbi:hypothetical protein GGR51DRAFT_554538 [Nemania sp. FL0031]|nr:hypothetical protein GGR51DRAFT_554538 [Nemania sp. FL0031]